MAPRAVGAKQRIESVFESFQRSRFVKTHLRGISNGFDVGTAASVRKL